LLALIAGVILACGGGGGASIPPPTIVSQPKSASIVEGASAVFSVTASGQGTLTYQWLRYGSEIADATEATYVTGPQTFSGSGSQIRVRVSNDGGEVMSEAATLTVTALCTGAKPNSGWCQVGLSTPNVGQVDALSTDIAWATGTVKGLFRTLDGGAVWSAMGVQPPEPFDTGGIVAVSPSVVWGVHSSYALGTGIVSRVYRTADAGKTWTPPTSYDPPGGPRWFLGSVDLRPVGADAAWLRDASSAFTTVDGGTSWRDLNRPLRYLAPVSAAIAWALPPLSQSTAANVVLVSTDGGNSWLERPLPATVTPVMRAISPLDELVAWVVGDGGAVFKTIDQGLTWTAQASGTDISLQMVRALDAGTVWAAGQVTASGTTTAVRTVDGGVTWSPVNVFGTLERLRPVGADAAWGGSDELAGRTIDGGANWTLRAMSATFDGIALAGKQSAWANAHMSLLRTVDGGASWQLLQPFNYFDRRLAATGEEMLWTAMGGAPQSTVAVTRDAARNWSAMTVAGYIFDIAALDTQTAWVGGWDFYRSDDGGRSWVAQGPGLNGWRMRLAAVNRSVVWAAGYTTTGVGCRAVSDPPEICTPVVLKTADGGSTWKRVLEIDPRLGISWFTGIAAVGERSAWVVGASGTILKSVDGGATWIPQASNTTRHLSAVAAVDVETAWVVGEGGTILSTVDGGTSWVAQMSGTDAPLTDVTASDRLTAWIVGANGTLLKTTTGGN
jgi:photosystem II stability/assembly factor-like uncharacterized protein